jgi:hypothetical protein
MFIIRRSFSVAPMVCLLLLVGCSEDEAPATSPGEGSSSEPASGLLLELDSISADVPQGWEPGSIATDFQISANEPPVDGYDSVTLFQVPDPSQGSGGVDRLAEDSLKSGSYLQEPEILEPTEVDGVEVFHIAGRINSASFLEEFGTSVDGQAVRIELLMSDTQSKVERQAIVDGDGHRGDRVAQPPASKMYAGVTSSPSELGPTIRSMVSSTPSR